MENSQHTGSGIFFCWLCRSFVIQYLHDEIWLVELAVVSLHKYACMFHNEKDSLVVDRMKIDTNKKKQAEKRV